MLAGSLRDPAAPCRHASSVRFRPADALRCGRRPFRSTISRPTCIGVRLPISAAARTRGRAANTATAARAAVISSDPMRISVVKLAIATEHDHADSNLIRVFPNCSSSPSRKASTLTRRPLTKVPFVESRSRTTGSAPSISTTAWARETLGSTRTISPSSPRPTRVAPPIEYTPSGGTPLTIRKEKCALRLPPPRPQSRSAPKRHVSRGAIVTRASPSMNVTPTFRGQIAEAARPKLAASTPRAP